MVRENPRGKLDLWKNSLDLVMMVHDVTKTFPKKIWSDISYAKGSSYSSIQCVRRTAGLQTGKEEVIDMKRVIHKAKNHRQAAQWDLVQQVKMTPAQRQSAAKELKKRFYGEKNPDVRGRVS